jgi:glycosyltransferase involved in cell wall biosynthesis
LRALRSNVFSDASDEAEFHAIEVVIDQYRLTSVVLDRQPGNPPDYATYSAYVCASSYEGFSMTVIEAAFHGCPPLMSDIPPHQSSARALFGDRAGEFLYPTGDHRALAALLRDEITTARRKAFLDARIAEIRAIVASRWSLQGTARALAGLLRDVTE